MGKSMTYITLAVGVFCVLISLSHGGLVDRYLNTKFFKKLSLAEQRAIISLAIAYHDAPESADDTIVFPTNPIKPKAEEIPPTLFATLMNGEVPNEWMKKFIKWLKSKGITDYNMNLYRHDDTDYLCTANNATCYSVTDVGQQCCPFG